MRKFYGMTNLDAGTVYKYRVYGKVDDQYCLN